MARIRSIKPELLEDEKTATLTHLEWRLFVSLLLLADDFGNFRAAPGRVKGTALWAYPDADVASALRTLDANGLIRLYKVDDQAYGHVAGWSKHQKVDHPGKPSCPGPEHADTKDSRDSRDTLAKVSRLIGSDGIGSEGTGSPPVRDPSAAEQADAGHDAIGDAVAGAMAEDEPAKPELWDAGVWLGGFGRGWTKAYQATFTGANTATPCRELQSMLEALPREERLRAQAKASRMVAAFLADRSPRLAAAKHPFSWFVTAFDGLRSDKTFEAAGANGAPRATGPPRTAAHETTHAAAARALERQRNRG